MGGARRQWVELMKAPLFTTQICAGNDCVIANINDPGLAVLCCHDSQRNCP